MADIYNAKWIFCATRRKRKCDIKRCQKPFHGAKENGDILNFEARGGLAVLSKLAHPDL